ncbi:MAG: GAF domain-containing protein [bacterium]|nr:GAF domain-containing protein [bacterium]
MPISAPQAEVAEPPPLVNPSLLSICQTMGSGLDLPEVLRTILELTLREMQAQEGSILLFDQRTDRLEMLAARGLPDEIVQKGYIPRKGSIAEWVIEHNQPLVLNEEARGKDFEPVDNRRRIVSSMCVPLRVRGSVLGTINLNRSRAGSAFFDDRDLDAMVILASQAAVAIENSRLHQTLVKSERLTAIGQTVAGISHCIKNILTGVRGGISLVEMSAQNEDWTLNRKGMDILRRNVDRLSSIMLDMLDYSKEREPRKNPVRVRELLDEVAGTVSSEAADRKITVNIRPGDDALTVDADGQQIYRCLLNLILNALDVTPQGGEVWLHGERHKASRARRGTGESASSAWVILRVGDTGPGISAEHRALIFEPFFSTKGSKGTGLGLAVTAKIVKEHGGRIEVESPPGQPAVFAIHLPA